jgi:class 3 adenylate cyclase
MAVFGVPTIHEDDALRAVRAAAELRDALASLNDELEHDYGVWLLLRTGVNTGEVVTGTEERLATGDAVNVAARLEQAAQSGEILIGEQTRLLARETIEVESLERSRVAARGYCDRRVSPLVRRKHSPPRPTCAAAVHFRPASKPESSQVIMAARSAAGLARRERERRDSNPRPPT